MKKGFTIYAHGIDYFFVTGKRNKTHNLVRRICNKLEIPDNSWGMHEVKSGLMAATLEVKGTDRKYYEISGDGFGGKGSFVDDGKTVVIELD